MTPSSKPQRSRNREAALTTAAVVLVGAGLFLQNGWPLTLGGFVLLVIAVGARA